MGVRDGDGRDPAQCLDCGNGGFIQQADAVPQHIPLGGLDEQCTLADGNRWLRPDAGKAVLFQLEDILMCLTQRVECGPLLALPANVLAWVFTDWAVRRGSVGRRKLDATSG